MQPGQDPLSLVTGAQAAAAVGPALAGSSSLAARRSAASGLPSSFELPPPPSLSALQNKYQPQIHVNAIQSHPGQGAGNLLTPPNTIPSEGISPPSSGGSSQLASSTGAAYQPQGASSYNPGLWSQSPPPQSQYQGYHTGSASQWIPPRGLYSPLNSMVRAHPDNVSGSSYEANQLPPFGNGMQMSSAQQMQAHQQAMMMNAQHHNVMTQASPITNQDPYALRTSHNPNYFQGSSQAHHGQVTPNSASAQQSGMSFSNGMHQSQVSPLSSEPQSARMSPLNGGGEGHMSVNSLPQSSQSPSHQFSPHQRAYSHPFSLPAMSMANGPVMSNMHSPNGQMSLVGAHAGMGAGTMPGGFNSGHAAASMQNMYGSPMSPHQHQSCSPPHHGHSGSHGGSSNQTPNDRPFKCDQCVQSFNRNHDLKRHKRIHLAVKPYPCGHCDKSFSRKDALKRHILVKGCGKMSSNGHGAPMERGSSGGSDGSISPMSNGAQMSTMSNSPPRNHGMMKIEA